MKNKPKVLADIIVGLCIGTLSVMCASCTDGFDEQPAFSSGVTGTMLTSPSADSITCVIAATGESATITWPVVMGASGYIFSFYNVDDPNNAVALVDGDTIDGCSTTVDVDEDTQYRVVLKPIGNAQYGNTTAETATQKDFSTLVETYMVIPSGTDLTAFFEANPLPETDEEPNEDGSLKELAYVMEMNGEYTISGPIDLSARKVTLRGEKAGHAKVTFEENGRIVTQNGLKLKFTDFDCAALSPSSGDAALISLSASPNEALKSLGYKRYFINDPIVLQSCNVKNLSKQLFYDNSKSYLVNYFVVKDCVVQMNQSGVVVFLKGSSFLNLTFQESTFWSTTKSAQTFLQVGGERPSKIGGSTSFCTFNGCTFYNISYGQARFINWSRYSGQASNTLTMKKNIFVDTGKGDITSKADNGNMTKIFESNTHWQDGALATDKFDNANFLTTDPLLADPDNGDFTVGGEEQLKARTGDPRWLPEATDDETTD